jgi:hypothetical protein
VLDDQREMEENMDDEIMDSCINVKSKEEMKMQLKGGRDLSELGKLLQNNKKQFFESNTPYTHILVLNSEPAEDEFDFNFGNMMSNSIKGRSDPLKANSLNKTAGGIKTGSTVTSENT